MSLRLGTGRALQNLELSQPLSSMGLMWTRYGGGTGGGRKWLKPSVLLARAQLGWDLGG